MSIHNIAVAGLMVCVAGLVAWADVALSDRRANRIAQRHLAARVQTAQTAQTASTAMVYPDGYRH